MELLFGIVLWEVIVFFFFFFFFYFIYFSITPHYLLLLHSSGISVQVSLFLLLISVVPLCCTAYFIVSFWCTLRICYRHVCHMS